MTEEEVMVPTIEAVRAFCRAELKTTYTPCERRCVWCLHFLCAGCPPRCDLLHRVIEEPTKSVCPGFVPFHLTDKKGGDGDGAAPEILEP